MGNKAFLKRKLDDLIVLMLTKGVQPSELADNIFLDCYVKVSYEKTAEGVIGELVFLDETAGDFDKAVMRYHYDNERNIKRIEEESGGQVKTLWDRSFKETQIINEIIVALRQNYSPSYVDDFAATLPSHLAKKIVGKYQEKVS